MTNSPWFPYGEAAADAELLVVCFPFAGGNAAFYRSWMAPARDLGMAVMPVELPGRGLRRTETPLCSTGAAVDALLAPLRRHLDRPFILFGHSLGALLAFEVAHGCRDQFGLTPTALVVSGRHAPHVKRDAVQRHLLPVHALKRELRDLNGTAPEILAHDDLFALLAPTLRADFAMTECYAYERASPALACPMVAISGADDREVSPDEMQAWRLHCASAFVPIVRPGDHFFLEKERLAILDTINNIRDSR